MYSSLLWEVYLSIKVAFELQILNFVRSVGNFIKTQEPAKKEQTKAGHLLLNVKRGSNLAVTAGNCLPSKLF